MMKMLTAFADTLMKGVGTSPSTVKPAEKPPKATVQFTDKAMSTTDLLGALKAYKANVMTTTTEMENEEH